MNPIVTIARNQAHSASTSPTPHQAPDGKGRAAAPADSVRFNSPDRPPVDNGDRDSRGRFVRGNHGGPGNPHARRSAALRQAMLEVVTVDDLKAIMRELIERARLGDVAAARLVLAYAVGKPDKVVDPDLADAAWEDAPGMAEVSAGPPAPATQVLPPAEVITPAAAPGNVAEPASERRRNEGEAGRSPRECLAKPQRPERRGRAAGMRSEIAEVGALLAAMSQKMEREGRPGFLPEIARRLADRQRQERTDGSPAPIANGDFLTLPRS